MHYLQGTRGPSLIRVLGHRRAGAQQGARPVLVLLLLAAAVAVADQASKAAVVSYFSHHPPLRLLGGALYIEETRNPGAAFSIAGGATVLFTGVAVVVIAVIALQARRLRSTGWALTLGLILGGAVGNLVDRLVRAPGFPRGHVVDWVDLRVWPVFNLADAAIVVGAFCALLLSGRGVSIGSSGSASAPDMPS